MFVHCSKFQTSFWLLFYSQQIILSGRRNIVHTCRWHVPTVICSSNELALENSNTNYKCSKIRRLFIITGQKTIGYRLKKIAVFYPPPQGSNIHTPPAHRRLLRPIQWLFFLVPTGSNCKMTKGMRQICALSLFVLGIV